MGEVFVIGTGMTRFGKYPDRSIKSLTAHVLDEAVSDAGIVKKDVQAAWFSNSTWGYFARQHMIRGQVSLNPAGVKGIPITNVENACSGGANAFHSAWTTVKAGLCDCALAIGAEKLYDEDRLKTFEVFFMGMDVEDIEGQFSKLSEVTEGLEEPGDSDPEGAGRDRSAVMDLYAGVARWHMANYGTTREQLAIVSSKNHYHGSMNPMAQYQRTFSVEEVLSDIPIVFPLTRAMCAPIGDGAAAAILCSSSFLDSLDGPRPVKVLASVFVSGDPDRRLEEPSIGERASRSAYEQAGLGPGDIDLAEVHDATAFGELMQTEAMGFCPRGGGGALAESGDTRLGGRLPVNTSGGLESRGHPLGATGLAQIHELVTQLRGEAGPRQVEGARTALAENGGGILGYEEASLCVTILGR